MKLLYYCTTIVLMLSYAPAYAVNDAPPSINDEQLANEAQQKRDSSVPSGDDTEVTIIQKKDAIVEEVRVNGKLRYAKITPKNGKAYYMYDSDGDGILDATETDIKKANVNQWILLEW